MSSFCNGISMTLTMFMMFLMTTDIVLRIFFKEAILGAFEITEVTFLSIVSLSFARAQVDKRHIHVDVLVSHMPPKMKIIITTLCEICVMVFVCLCAYTQYVQTLAVMASNKKSTVLIFPLWPFQLVAAIGMTMLFLVLVTDVLNNLLSLLGPKAQLEEKKEEPQTIV